MKDGGCRKSPGKEGGDSGSKAVVRQKCVLEICVDIACN